MDYDITQRDIRKAETGHFGAIKRCIRVCRKVLDGDVIRIKDRPVSKEETFKPPKEAPAEQQEKKPAGKKASSKKVAKKGAKKK